MVWIILSENIRTNIIASHHLVLIFFRQQSILQCNDRSKSFPGDFGKFKNRHKAFKWTYNVPFSLQSENGALSPSLEIRGTISSSSDTLMKASSKLVCLPDVGSILKSHFVSYRRGKCKVHVQISSAGPTFDCFHGRLSMNDGINQ